MKTAYVMMVVATLVIASCSSKAPKDPMIAACPEDAVSAVQQNQHFLDQKLVVDKTTVGELGELNGLQRQARLTKDGLMPMDVLFYRTGLPRCGWLAARESITPVVIGQGVVKAVGSQSLKDMIARGWELRDASWPWQRYDFSYLPSR